MSTDQKKKLLWGSKKNTTTQEVILVILFYYFLSSSANSIGRIFFFTFGVIPDNQYLLHILFPLNCQPSKRWDLHSFADRERQEKFNKLMVISISLFPVTETIVAIVTLGHS